MDLQATFIQYLATVTGVTSVLKPMAPKALNGLPVYLTQAYGLYELELFGRALLLALLKNDVPVELMQLAKDREQLAGKLGREVALVLPQLRSYERARFVQRRVPFIVPGRQMFLPMFLVDLRESFPSARSEPAEHLGWVAQVIILRHLLVGDITDRPLAGVAVLLRYSAMAITQGLDQLLARELCREVAEGTYQADPV